MMRVLRAAIVIATTLSLVGFSVPAMAMQASMAADAAAADTVDHGSHDHCCPQADRCDKPAKKGCDHSGVCAAKCSALSAAVVAEMSLPLATTPSAPRVTLAAVLRLTQDHPPLPPPKV